MFIIIFMFYFWNLAVPGSKEGTVQWGKHLRPVRAEDGRMGTPWFGRLGSRQGLVATPSHELGLFIPPTSLAHSPLDSLCLSFFPSME